MQIVGLEQEDGYAALTSANFEAVSYTHLDVYKRQAPSVLGLPHAHLRHRADPGHDFYQQPAAQGLSLIHI